MLKRLFLVLVVSSFILPYIGISLYLKHEKRMLKREIKHRIIEGMDRSELVELSFTREEEKQLRWEHSKEFEYNGQMYDVVETEIKNGKTVYWCWWDHAETTLNKQLNSLLAVALGQANNDPHPQDPLSSFLQLEFIAPSFLDLKNFKETEQKHSGRYQAIYQRILQDIPSPPPRA